MTDKIVDDNAAIVLHPEAVSILQAIFGCTGNENNQPAMEEGLSKVASVKFMITLQDEKDLGNLGYSQAQIDKMKPEEARDILLSGAKAVHES